MCTKQQNFAVLYGIYPKNATTNHRRGPFSRGNSNFIEILPTIFTFELLLTTNLVYLTSYYEKIFPAQLQINTKISLVLFPRYFILYLPLLHSSDRFQRDKTSINYDSLPDGIGKNKES